MTSSSYLLLCVPTDLLQTFWIPCPWIVLLQKLVNQHLQMQMQMQNWRTNSTQLHIMYLLRGHMTETLVVLSSLNTPLVKCKKNKRHDSRENCNFQLAFNCICAIHDFNEVCLCLCVSGCNWTFVSVSVCRPSESLHPSAHFSLHCTSSHSQPFAGIQTTVWRLMESWSKVHKRLLLSNHQKEATA